MARALSKAPPRAFPGYPSWRPSRGAGRGPVPPRSNRSPYAIADSVGHGLARETTGTATYGGDLLERAQSFDRRLLRLARDDGAARLVLGRLADRFLQINGWERLGFARLGDYGAERLGWSGRQLQELALVAGRLALLPRIEDTFRRGELGWSKTRLLTSIASACDETEWLAVASTTGVRALAAATASARAAMREQRPVATVPFPAIDEDDLEERVIVHVPCTRRTRQLWNEARRHAPRMAGRALAPWQVAELIAAEAGSSPTPFQDLWQREPWRSMAAAEAREAASLRESVPADPPPVSRASGHGEATAGATSLDPPASEPNTGFSFDCELANLEKLDAFQLDAFQLDAAMRRVRRAMQQRQFDLGISLAEFLDLRLFRELGCTCGADYVRERLGIPERTARELVRVAKAVRDKSPLLASAYAGGEVSWLQALTLLPVVRPWNAAAWIRRAREVTLRRLADEVEWTASRVDEDPRHAAAMPPASEEEPAPGDDRQMCADSAPDKATREPAMDGLRPSPGDALWGVDGRFHVTFTAPLSVSVLFRSVMQGFASPAEPRWKALERMLEHVLGHWRSQPGHRDPVFARDGHRCTVPGCNSFTNLHDHHIVPRSAGGSNDPANRTTLCAWHHLRAVHGGLARASGQAPDDIEWELGLSAGKPPLLHLRGDRYVHVPVG